MALVAWTERRIFSGGNKMICLGRATLASGTNHVDTGLRRIIMAPTPQPVSEAGGLGHSVITKINTAEGTQGDSLGKLTFESAEACEYHIIAYGI